MLRLYNTYGMKRAVKSLVVFLVSVLYSALLTLMAASFVVRFTLANPDTLKSWISNSGTYEKVTSEFASRARFESNSAGGAIQITTSDIASAAQTAFPSSQIKRDAETVIDAFYKWFRGESSNPEYRVDFSQQKLVFANELGITLQTKVDNLPECDATTRSARSFDPFSADCRPAELDSGLVAQAFAESIAESNDFLPQTVFTGDDIRVKNGETSQRIGSAWPWVGRVFSWINLAPFILLGVVMVSGLILVLVSSTRRRGIRRLAVCLIICGVGLVLSGLFAAEILPRLNISWSAARFSQGPNFGNDIVRPIVEEAVGSWGRVLLIIGGIYVLLALVKFTYLTLTKPPKSRAVEEEVSTEQAQEEYVEQLDKADEAVEDRPEPPAVHQEADTSHLTAVSEQAAVQPQVNSSVPSVPKGPHKRPIVRRPPLVQG